MGPTSNKKKRLKSQKAEGGINENEVRFFFFSFYFSNFLS